MAVDDLLGGGEQSVPGHRLLLGSRQTSGSHRFLSNVGCLSVTGSYLNTGCNSNIKWYLREVSGDRAPMKRALIRRESARCRAALALGEDPAVSKEDAVDPQAALRAR
jgi:hypothetical protein